MTIKEYSNTFRINEKTSKRDMKKLVILGYAKKVGFKKGAYFEAG